MGHCIQIMAMLKNVDFISLCAELTTSVFLQKNFAFWKTWLDKELNFGQGHVFIFLDFSFPMQKLYLTWARLCDKSKFYDSFSYQSSIVFPLILTCNISFENGLKSQIQ